MGWFNLMWLSIGGLYVLCALFFLFTSASQYPKCDKRYKRSILGWKTIGLWLPFCLIWALIGGLFWLLPQGKTWADLEPFTVWRWWNIRYQKIAPTRGSCQACTCAIHQLVFVYFCQYEYNVYHHNESIYTRSQLICLAFLRLPLLSPFFVLEFPLYPLFIQPSSACRFPACLVPYIRQRQLSQIRSCQVCVWQAPTLIRQPYIPGCGGFP